MRSKSSTKGTKRKVVPGSGFRYKGYKPNDNSKYVVDFVEYYDDMLPQFQDIVLKGVIKESV